MNPKHLMSFFQGTRNFLGQSSVQAEIYMSLARILRNSSRFERDENGIAKAAGGTKLHKADRKDTNLRHNFSLLTPEKER